jgi:uncharacterized membrane protein
VIEFNSKIWARWCAGFRGRAAGVHVSVSPSLETAQVSNAAKAEEILMSNKFVTFLDKVEADVKVGLADVVKYLPAASAIAGFIFPPAVAPLAAATTVAGLLQTAIADAQQKLAGVTGSGATKLANVLTVVTSSVTALLAEPTIAAELAKAGITVNTAYITNLVNAVVAYLNVQGVVATA